MWRAITKAASGNIVYAIGWDERDVSDVFNMYVAALENIGLDGAVWSARKANGNRAIRFENGGEVRFVSHWSQSLRGTRAGAVVMDA
jgi:hypothetical protein